MKNRELMAAVVAVAEFASPAKAKEALVHFTVDELTRSAVAASMNIDNTPPAHIVGNIHRLIGDVLEPARLRFGAPIYVNSGYRCPELNRAVGGVARSYHLQGRAADLTTGTVDGNRRLWRILCGLPHVELIWEGGGAWIHVAY